jgi:hypothetical protein
MSQTQAPPKSGTSWGCILTVGCLLPLLLCCGAGFGGFYYWVDSLKSSPVYAEAVSKAKAHDEVKALLGEPIEGPRAPSPMWSSTASRKRRPPSFFQSRDRRQKLS